jgi:hypothetical protein
MPCYLCAYQLDEEPEALDGLPNGSPAWAGYALGTCYMCNVWACALHGTRYGQFECAMCTPAVATQHALSPAAPPADIGARVAAAAVAYEVGIQASDDVRSRVRMALIEIARHQRLVSPFEALSAAKPRSGEPDLLLNFAEVIRARTGETGEFLPGVQPEAPRESVAPGAPRPARGPQASISIDALGGAVRAAFTGKVLDVTADAIDIVAGALLLSMAVANRPRLRGHGPDAVDAALEAKVAPPWRVTHPVLLDPVMWLIATAYEDQQ